MNVVNGFNAEYQDEEITLAHVERLEGDVLLEFGTPWCGYCKKAQPLLSEVMDDFLDVQHVKVVDGKGKRLGRHYQVKLWPTLIALQDGKEVGRVVRPDSEEEIRKLLDV